ncbi:tRNA 4-thiouridine(8) synthase ThiI [bacterium]|nr:tRNA 4-thiouridine(8) synthase ThiI [bacterium]
MHSLMIKYGELVLKKGNRSNFVQLLYLNIQKALNEFSNLKYDKKFDYLLINNILSQDLTPILSILKYLPGINKIYEVNLLNKEDGLENLIDFINLNLIKNAHHTFRVTIKRKDKSFSLTSMEFAKKVATSILLSNKVLKVDLVNYDLEIYIEIHKNYFFVLSNEILGIGGFPVSKQNATLVLISGGIDSPVAANLILKKGFHVDFITFISPPYTSIEAKNKTIKLARKITMNGKLCRSRLFIVNYSNIQNEISHLNLTSYRINLMRRSFFRISEHLCKYLRCKSITTGESLGQVASQTLDSMYSISEVLNHTLVFRPLLTYDKNQIIELAKYYKTYETSILPYLDSCSIFAPKNPVTLPNVNTAKELEAKIPLLFALEDAAIKKENMEIVKL